MKRHYRLGTWNGHPNYECAHCPYATLRPRVLVQHLRATHGVRLMAWPAAAGVERLRFASAAAAEEAGALDAEALARLEQMQPSGAAGGYTVADVREAAATATTASEE
jgi:hypothetical protein